jgi:hypothetical protein
METKYPVSYMSLQPVPILDWSRRSFIESRKMQVFYGEGVLSPRLTPELEDHTFSPARDCLLNILSSPYLEADMIDIRFSRRRVEDKSLIAPCGLVGVDRRFRGAYCLHHLGHRHHDWGSTHLWNVGILRDCTALYGRHRLSSVDMSSVLLSRLELSFVQVVNKKFWEELIRLLSLHKSFIWSAWSKFNGN